MSTPETPRRATIAEREGVSPAEVPADAVTASGSGLDPHISVAYALLQVPRVAAERDLPEQQVREVFAQLLQVAAQNGVTGTLAIEGASAAPEAPEEPPLPPLHAEAFAAIERLVERIKHEVPIWKRQHFADGVTEWVGL